MLLPQAVYHPGTSFDKDVYKRQPTDTAQFGVEGVAEEVIQVAPMPGAPVMEAIIAALS